MSWILTETQRPEIGDHVEWSDDGIMSEGTMVYTDERMCMLAGVAGGHGYFGEGFATDGIGTEYGLICDDPKFWRLVQDERVKTPKK